MPHLDLNNPLHIAGLLLFCFAVGTSPIVLVVVVWQIQRWWYRRWMLRMMRRGDYTLH